MKMIALAIAVTGLGLAAAPAGAQEAAAVAQAAKFNLDSPIEQIVADEKGKAALDAAVPGLTTHPNYDMVKSMTLNQLKNFVPDQLTAEVLAAAEKALAAVK